MLNAERELPFVSVIVPVFNVARYLPSCLELLLQRQGDDLEVIAVNDGSTDESASLLDVYAKRFPALKVESLSKNQGVSAARNRGLDVASGAYVLFVDADDRLAPDAIPRLREAVLPSQPDITLFQYRKVSETGTVLQAAPRISARSYDLRAVAERRATFDLAVGNLMAWNGLYRRAALQGLHFEAFPNGEDVLFGAQAYCRAQSFYCSDLTVYDYVQRQGSASQRKTTRHCCSVIDVSARLVSGVRSAAFYEDVKDLLFRKIRCMTQGLALTVLLAVPQADRHTCWKHWFDGLKPVFCDSDLVPSGQRWIYRFVFQTRSRWAVLLLLRLPIQAKGWLLSFPALRLHWMRIRGRYL